MTTLQKLTLGLSLIATTHLMGAKSAPESMGNITYNKANINCEADGKKNFIVDTVEMDNIGFDYTKFIPMLERKHRVSCTITGMIELPADITVDKVDIEVDKAKGYISYNGMSMNGAYYSTMNIQNIYDDAIVRKSANNDSLIPGKFFSVSVQQKAGKKYIDYAIFTSDNNENRLAGIPGSEIANFFKNSESYKIRYFKIPTKRNETAETIQLDKFFIFERKKK
jgi:hypothetical protein